MPEPSILNGITQFIMRTTSDCGQSLLPQQRRWRHTTWWASYVPCTRVSITNKQGTKLKNTTNNKSRALTALSLNFLFKIMFYNINVISFSGLYWMKILDLKPEMNQKANALKWCSYNLPPSDWLALFGFTFWCERMASMGKEQDNHATNVFILYNK